MGDDVQQHTRYFNSNDVEVPSVTTILKILNKPNLLEWANWMGLKRIKYDSYMSEVSSIGTATHDLISNYSMSGCVDINDIYDDFDYKTRTQILNCFDSFLKFIDDYDDIEFILSEEKLEGDLFGGTLDCYCKIGKHKYIIDYKTSKKVYASMFLQLGAYTKLLESKGYGVDKVAILRLDKDKRRYQFKVMDRCDLDKYINLYMNLAIFYHRWKLILDEWGETIV